MRYQPSGTTLDQAVFFRGVRAASPARSRGWVLFPLWLATLVMLGCSSMGPAPVESRESLGPVPPGYHRVRAGETLYHISSKRGLDYHQVARWNGIKPPYHLYAGSLLRVVPPGRRGGGRREGPVQAQGPVHAPQRTASVLPPHTAPVVNEKPLDAAKAPANQAIKGGLHWSWPLRGKLVQGYRAGDRTHEGIRIGGKPHEMVLAAAAGKVVYSGSGLKGYGNLIIIKHDKTYLSAYGFNRRLLVKEGDQVSRGQPIAEVGQLAGGGYGLHFEIRKNGKPVNPLSYLPATP
jgi:lipoprotein NlpD